MEDTPPKIEELHASAPKWRASDWIDGRREDFELGALLGRGSYACVYRARSRHSGDEVAIKIIEKQLIAASPGLAERVRAEAETHIALDHPSIVKLLTFFEDASCVYLVLELCEGGELYHHLRFACHPSLSPSLSPSTPLSLFPPRFFLAS